MPRLDTIRNRLVLLIFLITACAIGFVYLYVVPQLESSLTAEKLRRLEEMGTEQGTSLSRALNEGQSQAGLRRLAREISRQADSRVTLLAVEDFGSGPQPSFVIADSETEATAILPSYVAADAAVETGRVTSGVETVGGERVGESAVPVSRDGQTQWVAVLSSPLAEVEDNVALIRRQILIAGLIALIAALLAGFWAARILSHRLRRLRRAAEQVAEGDFSEPIPVESSDELGQLARAFNEMQRRLERLDSARKEFIANASHELRTPIFSLGGFVELLEHENPDSAAREQFVQTMREQVERLQKLTADLLDLSKLDAGAMEIAMEQVDLEQLARNVVAEFRALAAQRDSSLEVRSGASPASAMADPDRAAQIIRILLDNALIHTPEGTKVTVTVVRNGDRAQLIVGDEGPGIDPRVRQHVFDRFYTGDSATGSGLGLAIARELAMRMGGTIELDSRRGFTAFTVTLPVAERVRPRVPAGSTV